MPRTEPPSERGCYYVGRETEDGTEGYTVIYRPYITLRNGKKLYASAYGLKAWALKVRR